MTPRTSAAVRDEEGASVSSLMAHRAKRSPRSECARRVVAHVRESTEEQDRGYSPDGQRQAIARYAAEHGLEQQGDPRPARADRRRGSLRPRRRDEILDRLADTSTNASADVAKRRTALEERMRRMRDLYELGDLNRPDYLARREAINAELADLAPDPLPDLDQARKVLDDFGIFWRLETDPDAKRQLLGLLFEKV